jgi:choline-glycine betaine transporter
MGGIACAMLLVGGLAALQQAAVLGSVPFTFVIVGVAWCWIKALREETVLSRQPAPRPVPTRAGATVSSLVAEEQGDGPRRETGSAP